MAQRTHVIRSRRLRNTVVICDGDAAGGLDLRDDGVRRRGGFAAAVDRAAQVVDDDLGAARRQQERMAAAKGRCRRRSRVPLDRRI